MKTKEIIKLKNAKGSDKKKEIIKQKLLVINQKIKK